MLRKAASTFFLALAIGCSAPVEAPPAPVGPRCDDRVKNGSETDVDCGGGCKPCDIGNRCSAPIDCQQRTGINCHRGICQGPGCTNGIRDGEEVGVDCGGNDCPKCGVGSPCKHYLDCSSAVCMEGFCKEPTCFDGVTNDTESDIDCGGTICARCELDKHCWRDSDCKTGLFCNQRYYKCDNKGDAGRACDKQADCKFCCMYITIEFFCASELTCKYGIN